MPLVLMLNTCNMFRTYLFINDDSELKQVRRLERRELKLNDLRSQSDT